MSPTTARGRSARTYRYYVSAPLQQGRAVALTAGERSGIWPARSASARGKAKRNAATAGQDLGAVRGLRRVASDALEARIAAILGRLLPDASGDTLRIPLRIAQHPGALHLLLPASLRAQLSAHLIAGEVLALEAGTHGAAQSHHLRLTCPIGLHRRGGRTDVIATSKDGPRTDPALVRALRAAHAMTDLDAAGLPRIEAAPPSLHHRRVITLAFLSPELQKAILDGRQPTGLTLARMMEAEIPLCWTAQARMFGQRTD